MDADVCIVGAGAAGGVLALELARRGVRVIVLESGPRHDFARRWEYVRRYLGHQNPWRTPLRELDRHTVGGPQPYRLEGKRARGVGGSTLHWEGYALRLHASDFRLRSLHGIAEDWPLSYQDLEPYYGLAERALGVAGDRRRAVGARRGARRSRSPRSRSATPTRCSPRVPGLGIGLHHLPQARNSRGLRRPLAVPRVLDLRRLPHRGQGQHGPDPHPRGRGDRQRPRHHRGHRPEARGSTDPER